jgi:hypothetical protein
MSNYCWKIKTILLNKLKNGLESQMKKMNEDYQDDYQIINRCACKSIGNTVQSIMKNY